MRPITLKIKFLLLAGFCLRPVSGFCDETMVVGNTPLGTYNQVASPEAMQQPMKQYLASAITFSKYDSDFTLLVHPVTAISNGAFPASTSMGNVGHAHPAIGSGSSLPFVPVLGVPSDIGTNSITANWAANGNPAGTIYLVEISSDSSFGSGTVSVTTTSLSATFAGLNPGTQYFMQVQAIDAQGNASAFTALPSATTLSAQGPCADGYTYTLQDNQGDGQCEQTVGNVTNLYFLHNGAQERNYDFVVGNKSIVAPSGHPFGEFYQLTNTASYINFFVTNQSDIDVIVQQAKANGWPVTFAGQNSQGLYQVQVQYQ